MDWMKQRKERKAAFLIQLREIYPGWWLDAPVAQAIGNNIWEKQNRLTTKFQIYKKNKGVFKPLRCSEESFQIIYQNYRDGTRKAKLDLCREKKLERFSVEDVYNHRYGLRDVHSIVDRFVRVLKTLLYFFISNFHFMFFVCW